MKNEIYKRIPNLLRKHRRICGLRQRQVAKLLGLKNSGRISRWEKGECLPSVLNLFRLSVTYRALPDALFIEHVRAIRKEIHAREKDLFPEASQHPGPANKTNGS